MDFFSIYYKYLICLPNEWLQWKEERQWQRQSSVRRREKERESTVERVAVNMKLFHQLYNYLDSEA